MSYRVHIAFVGLLTFFASACTTDRPPVEVQGDCAEAFTGQICTWAKLGGTTLVEMGAVVPLATIENAPADAPMTWPPVPVASIDLPDAVREQTGLTQLTVNWEAHGHPPGAFMTPHFDFHFYSLAPSEVAAIDCSDGVKPSVLPAGYDLPDIPLPPDMASMMGVSMLVGLCVPKMGMHAIARTEIERAESFSGTVVVGYHKGVPIFIEPMISKATLVKRQSFDLAVPDVSGFSGAVPNAFRAEYDPAQQAYRFVLSGFAPAR